MSFVVITIVDLVAKYMGFGARPWNPQQRHHIASVLWKAKKKWGADWGRTLARIAACNMPD